MPQQPRHLQQWQKWLTQQALGYKLLAAEYLLLSKANLQTLGRHAALIGVPAQAKLLKSSPLPCNSLLSPLPFTSLKWPGLQMNLSDIPLATGSLDLVIVPHTLEFAANPRLLLQEACRIVRPNGVLVVLNFNPYSAWGLQNLLFQTATIPWQYQSVDPFKLKNWLQAASFQVEAQHSTFFRPAVQHTRLYKKLSFLEGLAKFFPMFGGVTALVARARVVPLTPIKLSWKAQLSELGLAGSAAGNIIQR